MIGQFPGASNLLAQLGPGLMYVKLSTRIGDAVVDPFGPTDPTTQAIMDALGIHMTVGFGPAPAAVAGSSLTSRLSFGAELAGGALLFLLRPRWSTAIVVGAGLVLLNPDLVRGFLPSSAEAEAA